MKSSAETNAATLTGVILVLVFALFFGVIATDFDPISLVGKIGQFLTNSTVIAVFISLIAIAVILLAYQLIMVKKIRREANRKFQETTELIIRPVRLYEITHELKTPITNFAEIQDAIKMIIRRGEESIPELVDYIITSALRSRASDVHLEPGFEMVSVKYRLDGVLQDVGEIPKTMISRFISRLRVLANLTIYDKGKPQDGRIEMRIGQRNYDVRLSIMPTLHGEKTVIRLFESGEHNFELQKLGMSPVVMEEYSDILLRSTGTILLTGPTGSGKTTTIYASIRCILQNRGDTTNVVTIEDPIEYEIRGVNQTQVNPKRDLTFASGLRSMLRQDPDVIMVGEIRDSETAEICSQAGFTGHLVISSIHADSAVGVFNRLIDMGIEPFLLASSISCVLAQRLVRRNCPHCSEPIIPSLKALKTIGIPADSNFHFMKGKGCALCNRKGFLGRTGIFELLKVGPRLREAIQSKKSTTDLIEIARNEGMVFLREDAIDKLRQGIFDIEELVRVIG